MNPVIKNNIFITFLFVIFINISNSLIIYNNSIEISTITCKNDIILLNNPSITFNNTIFQISGSCLFTSLVGIINVPVSSLSPNSTVINKLKLVNINLQVNGNNVLAPINNLLIENNEASSVTLNGIFKFSYSLINVENTNLFEGGLINIPLGSVVTLENLNTIISNLKISSEINNFNIFEVVGFKLGLTNINNYNAKASSFNYFYEGIFAVNPAVISPKSTLEFHNCTVIIGKSLNLYGGVLSLSNTEYQTLNNAQNTYFQNTSTIIDGLSTIILYREVNSKLTSIRLEPSSSFNLLQGISSVAFKIYTTTPAYFDEISEELIFAPSANFVCGSNYVNNNNTVSFKALIPGPLKMASLNACSSRGITSTVYFPNKYSSSIKMFPCQDGYYSCLSEVTCVPLGQKCTTVVCTGTDEPVNLPYNGESAACWNGDCAKFKPYSKCSAFPACPLATPFRCAGVCVSSISDCPDESQCLTKCVDGCYSEVRECQPFNGCPLYHFQCPNGDCVSDQSLCSTITNNLPYSNRFLQTLIKVYSGNEVGSVFFRNSDSNIAYPIDILMNVPSNSTLSINTIQLTPIADSNAMVINGLTLKPNFNYYKDLLSAPFSLSYNGLSTSFVDPVSIYIGIPGITNLSNIPLCLAFANSNGNWECTPFTPQLIDNGGTVIVKTNSFNSFFALVRTAI